MGNHNRGGRDRAGSQRGRGNASYGRGRGRGGQQAHFQSFEQRESEVGDLG